MPFRECSKCFRKPRTPFRDSRDLLRSSHKLLRRYPKSIRLAPTSLHLHVDVDREPNEAIRSPRQPIRSHSFATDDRCNGSADRATARGLSVRCIASGACLPGARRRGLVSYHPRPLTSLRSPRHTSPVPPAPSGAPAVATFAPRTTKWQPITTETQPAIRPSDPQSPARRPFIGQNSSRGYQFFSSIIQCTSAGVTTSRRTFFDSLARQRSKDQETTRHSVSAKYRPDGHARFLDGLSPRDVTLPM